MATTTTNPWADRWEYEIGNGYATTGLEGRIEQAMMKAEADEARAMPTKVCECGKTSYYRPGVSGWWCEDRHLHSERS